MTGMQMDESTFNIARMEKLSSSEEQPEEQQEFEIFEQKVAEHKFDEKRVNFEQKSPE